MALTQNEVAILISAKNQASQVLSQAKKDLDGIAKAAKNTDLGMPKLDKDAVSAQQHLASLEKQLDRIRAKSASGLDLSVGDVNKFSKLSSEAGNLKRQLDSISGKPIQDVANAAKSGTSALGQMNSVASSLLGGMGGVAGALGVAGLATLGVQIVRTGKDLGDFGQQLQRQQAYFVVWSGGAKTAAKNLEAMRTAIGGAASEQDMFIAANKFMSMGLAKNADELAKLSRMAVMLGGDTRSAGDAMQEFALLLANQSILRLDTFGISGAKVRERIEELQKATAGLSREQAFLQAVMEEGTAKMQQLEAAGVGAGTSAQNLSTALANARGEWGKLLAEPVAEIEGRMAKTAEAAGRLARSMSGDELTRLKAQLEQVNDALQDTNWLTYTTDAETAKALIADLERRAEELKNQIAQLEQGVKDAASAQNTWNKELDAGVGLLMRMAEEAAKVTPVWDAAMAGAGFTGNAPMMNMQGFTVQGQNMSSIPGDMNPKWLDWQIDPKKWWGMFWDEADLTLGGKTNTLKKGVSEAQKALNELAGSIGGWVTQAQGYAKSLYNVMPGGKQGMMAPGANGPFENLYRALDVAKKGGASPWAEQLGLTQEDARQISEDFQRGIMSEQVKSLIDVKALVKEAQLAQLAEASQQAFAEEIAKLAGTKTGIASSLLGIQKGGVSPTTKADITAAASQYNRAINGEFTAPNIDLEATGQALMQGMIDGMESMRSTAVTTAASIATAIAAAAAAALGVRSPSTVFMDIGRNTGTGFNIGYSETMGNVKLKNRLPLPELPRLPQMAMSSPLLGTGERLSLNGGNIGIRRDDIERMVAAIKDSRARRPDVSGVTANGPSSSKQVTVYESPTYIYSGGNTFVSNHKASELAVLEAQRRTQLNNMRRNM
jgi:hypothetical protein